MVLIGGLRPSPNAGFSAFKCAGAWFPSSRGNILSVDVLGCRHSHAITIITNRREADVVISQVQTRGDVKRDTYATMKNAFLMELVKMNTL